LKSKEKIHKTPIFGAMAVQRGSCCTVKIQQYPITLNKQVFYSHAHSDWVVLDKWDLTLSFNERVDGSSPSSLKDNPYMKVYGFFYDLSNVLEYIAYEARTLFRLLPKKSGGNPIKSQKIQTLASSEVFFSR
jgi:hypothetical protein